MTRCGATTVVGQQEGGDMKNEGRPPYRKSRCRTITVLFIVHACFPTDGTIIVHGAVFFFFFRGQQKKMRGGRR